MGEESMTLRTLIATLKLALAESEKNSSDPYVYFDFCNAFPLLHVGSSRCYYERPAVDWDVNRRHTDAKNQPPKLADFLSLLEDSIGKPITGYKGGDYTIQERHPLHVDGYGECTSTVVSGVQNKGWCIILETETY